MRKVFLSTMVARPISATNYVSEDFSLSKAQYNFPLTYLMEQDVAAEDEVLIATVVKDEKIALENYELYMTELKSLLSNKNVKLQCEAIKLQRAMGAANLHRVFKQLTGMLKDDDHLYLDLTEGKVPYALSLLLAGAYGIKAGRDADIVNVIYAEPLESEAKTKIHDITGLFYINELVGEVNPENKEAVATILDMIIKD